ncbi:MAG TPA: NTF2 fold immunity protein [Planctomycetota bacterium]|nr:NTF2 fold immunity protein [Planctomycetota bacterium]
MLKPLLLLLAPLFVLPFPAAPPARTEASDAARIRQALDTLAAQPRSPEGAAAAATIAGIASSNVAVELSISYITLPWTTKNSRVPHADLLLAAHQAGNMLSQFDSGVRSNDAYSGTLAVFRVYRQLQADENGYSVPAIDDMLKAHRLGRLTAHVQTPRGLSETTPISETPALSEERRTNPKVDGYVPDAETAIAIALAVWEPIYGHGAVTDDAPYKATLEKGVWSVRGSLPEHWLGGTAEAQINRADGRILKVWASK